ncbi:UDP-glucose 4-epimerase [Pelagimonas phthalicica]|uniref:UDP-glucose 4-epimerase n=1 Tax=Pelagimonas phthalicica TaxID=1037362 RepID=A0A238JAH0_9RHOB|nr:UDP-glucose 4-epimerase GalE [Pelagimonas phthalicica]TDS94269.1 UDP-L-arabinose 4-epimerase [Pelagimonas phthalicica]SMX27204.1 UDP-glucose 4-epimerase [Pelagimonas phthalicica]
MTQKILVLGGAGYIGSHTCKKLRQKGFDPVTFDNLSDGHGAFVKWGELILGDIRSKPDLDAAIAKVAPAAIIHFAALAYVGESVSDPAKYYENNTLGSLNVVQAAADAGNIPIIFSSTCATYGTPDVSLITEETQQQPINPYGRSKRMVEQILQDFSAAYDLRSVSLRYFNAAGGDADLEVGEAHRQETHLIPRAILSALGRIDDFAVFGDDYDTSDGSAVRDYIHVSDLAEAHAAACSYLLNGGRTDVFNLGVGKGYSVFEVIKAVEAELNTSVPFRQEPRRPGDPASLISDPAKAKRLLGFEAKHSSLENIIHTAARWHCLDWQPKACETVTLNA